MQNRFVLAVSWLGLRRLILLALVAMLFILAGTAYAQETMPTVPDDAVNAVAKDMFCPVCENIPLDVCGTQACAQWRELIRLKLSQGESPEEIKAYFVEQYGDRVLAEPPRRGLNWLVYIVPPLAVLIGVVFVVRAMRSWQKNADEALAEAPPTIPENDYVRRLEEELKDR
jgi:cytochrome c-type biogenesis protein CcmH